jgi:arsenical pump membrane protein
MVRSILGGAIFVATLISVMVRPYRVSEAVSASAGALLMLAFGLVRVPEAAGLLAGEWNTLGFFLGLMVISAVAEEAGVFNALGWQAARWGRGSAARLYLAVFAVGTLITVFLSNDATALILTPVVYALVTRLRLPVLPFVFACTFIADTASMILPVSNPINIIILHSFGTRLGEFLRYLLLPAAAAVALNTVVFLLLFRRDLAQDYQLTLVRPPASRDTKFLGAVSILLVLIAGAYLAASATGFPLSLVALGGALVLIGATAVRGRLSVRSLAGRVSWSLFLFIAGMLIVVRGVEDLGFTAEVGRLLAKASGGSPFASVLLVTAGTALGSNLVNNVPMALVMVSTLHSLPGGVAAGASLPFAAMFGADLGPNLTTVGSLATMLWLLILRRRGVEVSTMQYFRLGITFVPALLVIGSLLIWARL